MVLGCHSFCFCICPDATVVDVAVETVEERQEHVVGKEEETLRGLGVLLR